MASTITTNTFDSQLIKSFSSSIPTECGHMSVTSRYQTVWPAVRQIRLVFVTNGTCSISSDSGTTILAQNDIFIMFKGVSYTIHNYGNYLTELYWIDTQGDGITNFLDRVSFNDETIVLRGISNPGISSELNNLSRFSGLMDVADTFSCLSSFHRILSIISNESISTSWNAVKYDSPDILYTGLWNFWPSPIKEAGSSHNQCYTGTRRSYAEFNFYGTGIRWYGTVNFDCGKADVMIDGIYQTTVDTYNEVRLTKQLLYSNTNLNEGHHIIKIFCTGDANIQASNCDVVIESFQYLMSSDPQTALVKPVSSSIIRKAVEYINDNQSEQLSVNSLAEVLKVSRSYLSSRFSFEMGLTVSQYINNHKMTQARQLLVSTDFKIAQVASTIGFKDAYYFSRFFKTHEGITPSEYRKINTPLNHLKKK